MTPTIGRIVNYKLTKDEKKRIQFGKKGVISNDQPILPAVIVAVHGDQPESVVNLKVMVDGDAPDLWVTSVGVGKKIGTWAWPVIKK